MKTSIVRDAAIPRIRRTAGEERSVGLGMVVGCGGILHRERSCRKRELRRLTQINGLLGAETSFELAGSSIPILGEACKQRSYCGDRRYWLSGAVAALAIGGPVWRGGVHPSTCQVLP